MKRYPEWAHHIIHRRVEKFNCVEPVNPYLVLMTNQIISFSKDFLKNKSVFFNDMYLATTKSFHSCYHRRWIYLNNRPHESKRRQSKPFLLVITHQASYKLPLIALMFTSITLPSNPPHEYPYQAIVSWRRMPHPLDLSHRNGSPEAVARGAIWIAMCYQAAVARGSLHRYVQYLPGAVARARFAPLCIFTEQFLGEVCTVMYHPGRLLGVVGSEHTVSPEGCAGSQYEVLHPRPICRSLRGCHLVMFGLICMLRF